MLILSRKVRKWGVVSSCKGLNFRKWCRSRYSGRIPRCRQEDVLGSREAGGFQPQSEEARNSSGATQVDKQGACRALWGQRQYHQGSPVCYRPFSETAKRERHE